MTSSAVCPRNAVSHGPPNCRKVIVFIVAILSCVRRRTLVLRHELQRDRVHTMPRVLRCEALPREDVAEMAAARGALDLDAPAILVGHAVDGAFDLLIERRPPAARVELRIRDVERRLAAPADVGAFQEEVVVRTGERVLGALVHDHACLFRRQLVQRLHPITIVRRSPPTIFSPVAPWARVQHVTDAPSRDAWSGQRGRARSMRSSTRDQAGSTGSPADARAGPKKRQGASGAGVRRSAVIAIARAPIAMSASPAPLNEAEPPAELEMAAVTTAANTSTAVTSIADARASALNHTATYALRMMPVTATQPH